MTWLISVSFYLGVVLYSVAATLFLVDLGRTGVAQSAKSGPRVLGAASVAHAAHIFAASWVTQVSPVESLQYALSASALIACWVFLALRLRLRIDAMGVIISPLGLSFMVGAQFVRAGPPSEPVSRSLLAAHVTANLLGFGLFLMAGAAGLSYLLQERRLKAKRRLGGISRMPALDTLDRTEHRLLVAGFILLTLGVVTGAAFSTQLSQAGAVQQLRAALAYVTWVVVAVVLVLRGLAGWRGRRAAYGTLAGVIGLMLVLTSYVVSAARGLL
ncbi:MAG: cytochrome c biogenesis protein CcsA [Polyangiaceae bacterium]|nr:cytochrome c biogenesis protein CcsA [Polyangiaceae bacterium]MCW5789194.1 cytochrome c biogenesis protein CcsA [Polyangiaceae bacterium]